MYSMEYKKFILIEKSPNILVQIDCQFYTFECLFLIFKIIKIIYYLDVL